MQKIIEFKKRNFWSSQVDINQLNDKIYQLNQDGWRVLTVTANNSYFSGVFSYTLLLEIKDT